jgi:hypothetical protein
VIEFMVVSRCSEFNQAPRGFHRGYHMQPKRYCVTLQGSTEERAAVRLPSSDLAWQAIADASSGETITFSSKLCGQTTTLTSGELDISNSIKIDGLGANQLAVGGGGSNRVFQISSGAVVTISGLTITDGLATDGAGAVNQGTLTLDGCSVTSNQANFDSNTSLVGVAGFGGGLENLTGANLTIKDSTVSGNQSAR